MSSQIKNLLDLMKDYGAIAGITPETNEKGQTTYTNRLGNIISESEAMHILESEHEKYLDRASIIDDPYFPIWEFG